MRQALSCPWPALVNLSLLPVQKGTGNTDYHWAIWCLKKPKKAVLVECEIPWICQLLKKPSLQLLTYFNTRFHTHFTGILGFPVLLESASAWQSLVLSSLASSGLKAWMCPDSSVFPHPGSHQNTKARIPVYRAVFRIKAFPVNLPKGLENTCKARVECWKKIFFAVVTDIIR